MRTRNVFVLTLALALAAIPSVAMADAADVESDVRFDEGVQLAKKRQFEAARAKFLQAYALAPHAKILLNLCIVEKAQNLEVEALGHCREYLAHVEAKADVAAKVREGLFKDLMASTGHIKVQATPGVRVAVNGKVYGTAPLPEVVDVKPGDHEVSAAERATRIRVAAGDTVTVNFETSQAPQVTVGRPDPKGSGLPAAPPGELKPKGGWTAPVVLGLVGAAGLGVAGAFGVMSISTRDSAVAKQKPGTCASTTSAECVALQSDLDAASTQKTVAMISGIGGGVFLGVALITLVAVRPWELRPVGPERPVPKPRDRAFVTPVFGESYAGAAMVGSF